MNIADKKLNELQKYWVGVLGLGEWNIKIDIVRLSEMAASHHMGECSYVYVGRAAQIRIVDECDAEDFFVPLDQEKVLVHELLHLRFADLNDDEADDPQGKREHQLLDDMATALIRVRRSK